MRNLQALSLAVILIANAPSLFSQTPYRACATREVYEEHAKFYPEVLDNTENIERHTQKYINSPQLEVRSEVITIPVVIHIVYRAANPAENISDEQVLSQLEVLNNDYRRLNKDGINTPSVFLPYAADCGIEFKLAVRTPDGKATNGIMRYESARKTSWGKSDEVKMPSVGGIAPWNPSKYLNLYVCAIGGGILGYSSMPGTLAAYDGIVIDYRFFGTMGTAVAPFNLGRTTTHEIGHWLNLRHTWGDSDCGDDLINDTPKQREPNYGCVTFPHISCSNDSKGDMFMNFMDYTDDACMNMFSSGQKVRIRALFASGGVRASLLTSDALTLPNVITKPIVANDICSDIYESNNTFSTAKDIPLNTMISGFINEVKDNDYFIFKVDDKRKHIQVALTNLPFDYDVRIYNSQRQLVGSSNRKGNTDEKIVVNNAPMDDYYVRVFSTSESSETQCYKLTVNVAENIFTRENGSENLDDFKTLDKLQTYPNPATDNINIELEIEEEGTAQVNLVDMTGKIVLHKTFEAVSSNNNFRLDITHINNGFYMLNVRIGNENYNKKVMVGR